MFCASVSGVGEEVKEARTGEHLYIQKEGLECWVLNATKVSFLCGPETTKFIFFD